MFTERVFTLTKKKLIPATDPIWCLALKRTFINIRQNKLSLTHIKPVLKTVSNFKMLSHFLSLLFLSLFLISIHYYKYLQFQIPWTPITTFEPSEPSLLPSLTLRLFTPYLTPYTLPPSPVPKTLPHVRLPPQHTTPHPLLWPSTPHPTRPWVVPG